MNSCYLWILVLLTVHQVIGKNCPSGSTPVSVIGGRGVYCTKGDPCAGSIDNYLSSSCPGIGSLNVNGEYGLNNGACCTQIHQSTNTVGCVSLQFPSVSCVPPKGDGIQLPDDDTGDDTGSSKPNDGDSNAGDSNTGDDSNTDTGSSKPIDGDSNTDTGSSKPIDGDSNAGDSKPIDGSKNTDDSNLDDDQLKDDNPNANQEDRAVESSGLNAGSIIGIVIGLLILIAIVAGFIYSKNKRHIPAYLPEEQIASEYNGGLTPRASVAML